MVSLAQRRGRSALGVYEVPVSIGGGARRQHSAPPISKTLLGSLSVSSLLPPVASLTAVANVPDLSDPVRGNILALDGLVQRLHDAIANLIADDAEWLEEQYGLGRILQQMGQQHQALVAHITDLHGQLGEARKRTDLCAAQYDQQQHVFESLQARSWTTPDALQDAIVSLEKELRRLDPERSMDVPDALLQVGPVQSLIALRFQRQDDLLFVMRRRLAQMSVDQPLAECLDEFRSLHALLDELHRLRQQNAQLQLRERRFHQSALLRRRPLNQCSGPLLQVLVVALQNELSAVHEIVAELEPGHHPLRQHLSKATPPPDSAGAIDVDRLYAELTGSRPNSVERKPASQDFGDPVAAADLDLEMSRTMLQLLANAVETVDFVSVSAARSAKEAVVFLQRQLDLVESTVAGQHDLIRDRIERLTGQRLLNLKLTGLVQELLLRAQDRQPTITSGSEPLTTGALPDSEEGQRRIC